MFLAAAMQVSAADIGRGAQLYRLHCASCHGADRLGGIGPALLPESLERLRPPLAAKAIALVKQNGATYMDLYGRRLVDVAIAIIVGHLFVGQATWSERNSQRPR